MARRSSALVALALGSALVLGGCGSDEQRAEDAIEKAAKDAGEDVDVDVDGDDVTIKSSDGTVSMGGDLPDGFPEDDIPLADGDIQLAMGAEGEGWQISIIVDASPDEAVDAGVSLLEGAGFSVDDEAVMGDITTASLSSSAYMVFLTGSALDDQTALLYSIEVE